MPVASASPVLPAVDQATAVVQGMSEGVFTVDEAGLIRFVNAAAEDMLGWSGADLVGRLASRTIARRMGGRRGRPRPSRIDRARAKGVVVRVHDDVFMRRDGVEMPVAYTVTPLPGRGGGSVVVFSDAGERAADAVRPHGERAHAAIVARVRQALSQDDFVLFAQPVYDLRSMEVHTHELLIRMREPNGHLRPPAQFLPVAARSSTRCGPSAASSPSTTSAPATAASRTSSMAEGVESRACLEVLADLGVDYAQGYRLMRPAPLDLGLRAGRRLTPPARPAPVAFAR